MKKITSVIFDFDGVIADTLPFSFKKIHEIAKALKVDRPAEKKIIKEIRSKDWKDMLRTGMDLSWFKIPFVLMMVHRMQNELGKEIDKVKFFPGMKKLIIDLKKNNFILGIVSSNQKTNIEKFLSYNKIEFFNFIEAKTNSLLGGKTELINNFFNDSKVKKENTIYVGDEIRDINASRKSGIKIIAVTWGLHTEATLRKNKADYIVTKASDILKIVTKN